MKKNATLEPGTFVQIPLTDGSFGYGRVLENPHIAFYDHRTAAPSADLDEIESKPVLFRQAVRLFDYKRWTRLGRRDLRGETARPVVVFMQDLADFRKCTIYDSAGLERAATPEECVGLERSAVWDPPHVERRLLDHFTGQPNEFEVRARVRLS